MHPLLAAGVPGLTELLLVVLVALLVFGVPLMLLLVGVEVRRERTTGKGRIARFGHKVDRLRDAFEERNDG